MARFQSKAFGKRSHGQEKTNGKITPVDREITRVELKLFNYESASSPNAYAQMKVQNGQPYKIVQINSFIGSLPFGLVLDKGLVRRRAAEFFDEVGKSLPSKSKAVSSENPSPQAVVPEISPGPSMEEAKAQIERELPLLGAYSIVVVKNDDPSKPSTYEYAVESAVLSDCRLSIRWTLVGGGLRRTFNETVTLKDIDVSKVLVAEKPVANGFTRSGPSYFVPLIAAADRGEPFTSQVNQGKLPAPEIKPTRTVRVPTHDLEAANRVADVLRRAAVLCGAPNQPVVK